MKLLSEYFLAIEFVTQIARTYFGLDYLPLISKSSLV